MYNPFLIFLFSGCLSTPETVEEAELNRDEGMETAPSSSDDTEPEPDTGSAEADASQEPPSEPDGTPGDEPIDTDGGEAPVEDDANEVPALGAHGPNSVLSSTGSFAAADDCNLTYTRYETASGESLGDAIILHGFMRGQDEFSNLASHLASWGITSTTVDLCHSSITDVDSEQNSRDVIDLANHLGADRVVWMGQSNGGVSALIAGGMAPEITAGVLGLDPVESFDGSGAAWSDDVESPAAALFGISDSCNNSNSGYPVYAAAADSVTLRITESDHCSFEFPTGLLCTALCERPKTLFTSTDISRTILEFSTAWALERLDDTFDGSSWWTEGGDRYTTLTERGAISSM